ncbi:MAG: hypothetical protein IIB95_11795 [Candidatus Marinimicrobia bacterium]|nr:hypothetical protein [Candidatus Neomarinimicrobiota bacterium]
MNIVIKWDLSQLNLFGLDSLMIIQNSKSVVKATICIILCLIVVILTIWFYTIVDEHFLKTASEEMAGIYVHRKVS